jgi:hypothetical protein
MSDPITAGAALAAGAVYIARTAYELVLKARNGAGETHKRCEADRVAATMQGSMNEQTNLLKEIKESQQDTRDGVRELITIQRRG